MLKQKFIIALLLLAFGVVLTHSIVPHHHHKSELEAKSHHNDDPIEQSFELYKHAGNSGDCFLGGTHDYYFQASECQALFYFDFKPKVTIEASASQQFVSQNDFIFSRKPFPSLSFRGPPQA